jgi:competence protein ComEC
VPLAEWLLVAAGVGALAESVVAGAGAPWFAAAEPLAWSLHALTRLGGAWPGALPATGHHAWAPWGVALGALLLALGLARGRARMAVLGGALAVVTIALALLAPPLRPPPGRWWLVALDVGQGDAIAIGTREGWWLVDTGPRSPRWDAGEGVVLPFLRWAGVKQLEALVLTHDDGDHTGGARALGRGLPVRGVWAPGPRPGVAGPLAHLRGRPLVRGDTLAWSPSGRVLWPPCADEPEFALSCRGDNASSLVLELGEGGGVALLAADADSVVELELAAGARPALLKAGHHGSGSSSGARFLVRLGARVAIVSCGSGNPYGHPAPGTLARLDLAGTRVERTDVEGALWYELDVHGARRLDWRQRAP